MSATHDDSGTGVTAWRGKRYVALGSSYASGPGITPRVPGTPRLAGRSRRDYPHLVAAAAGLALTDVTSSGATCDHLLHARQFGQPPQLTAVTPETDLVTVTIGGNDIGLTPYLIAGRLPRPLLVLPPLARMGDPSAVRQRLPLVEDRIAAVLRAIRERAPGAGILVVNYLSVLGPPADTDSTVDRHYRAFAESLAAHTAAAAERGGAELIDVRTPSLDHAAGSPDPWTVDFYFPWPGRTYDGAPCHPTAAGMAAAAELVLDRLAVLSPTDPARP
ncbi:SGNH/GDSL hydrolase family protein [Nocardia brasiliensis]|uniref:SGNH/GDSL hydrolase family protein n=1 Tax=Nocardia brasiliensis TaxID=37326 RepID=A0A6G9XUD7_NOCBR|nr:SGNH/GDSL hydrolase family protein [Nocardia brasiliensis]QIS04508.1 SGNH/GDSL hydrolase family protein [Nocardia brasiliensis]